MRSNIILKTFDIIAYVPYYRSTPKGTQLNNQEGHTMTRKDAITVVIATVSAIALIAVAIVTDTPILAECNVNTRC